MNTEKYELKAKKQTVLQKTRDLKRWASRDRLFWTVVLVLLLIVAVNGGILISDTFKNLKTAQRNALDSSQFLGFADEAELEAIEMALYELEESWEENDLDYFMAELGYDENQKNLNLDHIPGIMTVETDSVITRAKIPLGYTCYRQNVSIPVSWYHPPEAVASYVVMFEKVGADNFDLYWGVYNIAPDVMALKKGASTQDGIQQAVNIKGKRAYAGPCDPKGRNGYRISVYAMDSILEIQPPYTREEMIKSMDGHVLDAAFLDVVHIFRL